MDLKGEDETFAPEYRDRLRTWLEKMINSGTIPGLCWENKDRTIFRMPWKHAGRQDYNLEEDSKIFMAWAIHSGRYREGIDKPEPIVWKTRLRCALNKMPDIRELPERSRLDISEPYRVYQLLPPVHKASQIRRRLYKRSQSHESDQLKQLSDHSRTTSFSHSPQKEEDEWERDLSVPRRDSSLEANPLGNSKTQRSSLTSMAATGVSPRFWITPSVNLPLKPPISSAFNNSLHVPQPLAIDPTNPLQTLAHQRYPLIPSLHNPFAASFANSPLSFFPTTASLETFKRLGFGDTSLFTRQKYQEQLSSIARKLEENNQSASGRNRTNSSENESDKHRPTDTKSSSVESSAKFYPKNESNVADSQGSLASSKPYYYLLNERAAPQQLNKLQMKIESLEKELEKVRSAHAQEKKARIELEKEREVMKMTLERMGDSLRALAVHIHPREDKILEQFRKDFFREHQMTSNKVQKDDESLKRNSALSSPQGTASPPHRKNSSGSIESSPFSNSKDRPTLSSQAVKQKALKRANSPLDLTVNSPGKKPRISIDEEPDCSGFPIKSPVSYVNSSFVTSFSEHDVSEDKRVVPSPLSMCSGSPDRVTPSGEGEGRGNFVNHSPSPLQHGASILHPYPQRHSTIQVT